MIIHAPQLRRLGSEIQLSVRVECEGGARLPEALWFRFPAEFENEVCLKVDPFVVALLLLAMQKGEDLEVRAPISRKLLEGLASHQRIFHSWYPERFKIISIRASGFHEAGGAGRGGQACAFSGGVDSFYTFLKLHRENENGPRLTHALFMAGFDMPLHLTASIAELATSFRELMREEGVRLVCGATNVRAFVNSVDWTNAHGPALAASALFFDETWSRFYVPSSYTLGAYPKWGTHPELDSLFSTEALQFVHHGADANRVRKLELVSRFEGSFARLRVCWIQDIGLLNCAACEKCIRTQLALELLEKLGHYTTFSQPLRGENVRRLPMRTRQSRIFARELINEALARGKWRIARDLGVALARRQLFHTRYRLAQVGTRMIRRFSFRAPGC